MGRVLVPDGERFAEKNFFNSALLLGSSPKSHGSRNLRSICTERQVLLSFFTSTHLIDTKPFWSMNSFHQAALALAELV